MLRIAGRQGPTFALRITGDTTLGRAAEAGIVVADRLASRVHAAVHFEPASHRWMLRDLGSRNGTWLDGQQITAAPLTDGATVRIGTSELVFRHVAVPTVDPPPAACRFVRCGPVAQLEGSVLRRASAGSTDDVRRPLLLYQASIRLLASRSVRDVIGTTLELAAEHCGTKGVGWFKVHAAQQLEPLCVVPPGSPLTRLFGDSTRRLVVVEGHAVWIADATTGPDGEEHEIACIPMVEGGRVHAALAAIAAKGALRAADFDFLVALASLAAAACAGHSEPPNGQPRDGDRRLAPGDLASLQTVELDASGEPGPDEDAYEGTINLNESAMADFAAAWPDEAHGEASRERTRIESFVTEIPTLKLDQWQRMLVVEALRRTGGSVPGAAAELGISRTFLHRQLERYGLIR